MEVLETSRLISPSLSHRFDASTLRECRPERFKEECATFHVVRLVEGIRNVRASQSRGASQDRMRDNTDIGVARMTLSHDRHETRALGWES